MTIETEPETRPQMLRRIATIFRMKRNGGTVEASAWSLAAAEALEFQAAYLEALDKSFSAAINPDAAVIPRSTTPT